MATVVDYQYIPEISTQEALQNMTSDMTTWYDTEIPWVNTFKINAQVSTYNFPEWWGWDGGIAWWSTNVTWSSSAYNRISWSSWYIYLPDWSSLYVASWSATLSAVTYIYYDQTDNNVYYTTSAESSVWDNKVLLCVAWPTVSGKSCTFQAFGTNAQSTFITADNVAANTITSNSLIWNTITWRTIQTASSWERFVMSSSEVAQYDSNWRLRVEYMGDGITFHDTSWNVTTSIVGVSGWLEIGAYQITTTAIIDCYSLNATNGNFDNIHVDDYLQNSWDTYLTWTLRIPVWTDLYN